MNAYTQLQKLMLSKNLSENTKKAVRERLMMILDNHEKQFKRWNEIIKEKLNITRRKAIERKFNKEIQALKIVIYMLTPFFDRTDDEPSIIIKKPKKD